MNQALLTSKKQNWETPPEVFGPLNDEFAFTLDPCAETETAKCAKFYTINDNGLFKCWAGESVFVNPPYGRHLKKWIAKAVTESKKPGTTVVMLIPSRTDTAYFHDYILPNASEIRFLRGRIKFLMDGKIGDSAPFGSLVVVFKPVSFVGDSRIKDENTLF